jgi:uncharacterized protein YfdQ (DUF2303 family)
MSSANCTPDPPSKYEYLVCYVDVVQTHAQHTKADLVSKMHKVAEKYFGIYVSYRLDKHLNTLHVQYQFMNRAAAEQATEEFRDLLRETYKDTEVQWFTDYYTTEH